MQIIRLIKKIPFPVYLFSILLLYTWYQNSLYSEARKYLNKTILRIDFTGNTNISSKELYNAISMRPGMVLTTELVNNDLKALFQLEAVSNVRIEGSEYKEGVGINFIIEEHPVISSVKFKGVKELNEPELRDLIPLKDDKVYSDASVATSIQLIMGQYYGKGFLNVSIRTEKKPDPKKKNAIVFTFIIDEGEELKISKINIIGASKVDSEDIYSILELEEEGLIKDGTFSESKFERDKSAIIELYNSKGYLDAEITEAKYEVRWKNPLKMDERVIIITYHISEGDVYFFNGYAMEWDQAYVNQETNIQLFQEKDLSYFFEYTDADIGGPFDNNKYNRDKGSINFQYSEKGYIFARVIPDRTVTLLTPEGIAELENSSLQKKEMEKGNDYYNISELRKIYEKEPEKRGKKFVHTRFIIGEGDKGFIENIIIKGNVKTHDNVIRRELLVKEGELFNAALVQRSREKVFNLGFFKEVNVDARPGSSEGQMNLIIQVEEQPTGNLSLGGGYGSLTGFSINTSLSENNLRGTGQSITGQFEFGLKQVSFNGSWTEPWIMDKPWSLTLGTHYYYTERRAGAIDVASKLNEQSYYYYNSVGASVSLGHRFWINWGNYHTFSMSYSRVTDPSSLVDDSIYILVKEGWQLQNKLTNGIYYDTLDNMMGPTSGVRGDLSMDFVGSVLGGQDHFNRYNAKLQFYWWPLDFTFFNSIRKSVLRRWRVVLEHRFSVNYTQQTKPAYGSQDRYLNPYIEDYDKLYLGGYESLRGWNVYDNYFPAGWRNGGSHRVLYGSELRVPIEPSMVWLVLFFDAGALYNDMNQYYIDNTTPQYFVDTIKSSTLSKEHLSMEYFKYSWGFGARVHLPVLPIRVYMGQRLMWDKDKFWFKKHSQAGQFEFVFGIGDKRF